uniref:Membrane insertase YidC/Oxa/ALB C-terminal domain-containing protein n=1 Tax=Arcella intermedia TaxID=1963864 RepID=A0A6B2LAW9_9EUKA
MNLGLEVLQLKYDIPWWALIAGISVGIRLGLAYFTIKQIRISMIVKSMEKELESNHSMDLAESLANQKAIYQRHGISMWQNFSYSIIQIPFVLLAFWSIRGLCIRPEYVDLASGGFWWFRDLTAVDPYYALPVLTGLVMLISNEIFMKATGTSAGVLARYGSRAFSVFFCWLCTSFPMGVNIYWLGTSFSMGLINLLLCWDRARIFFKIPTKSPQIRYISLSDTPAPAPDPKAPVTLASTTTTVINKAPAVDYSKLTVRPKKSKK